MAPQVDEVKESYRVGLSAGEPVLHYIRDILSRLCTCFKSSLRLFGGLETDGGTAIVNEMPQEDESKSPTAHGSLTEQPVEGGAVGVPFETHVPSKQVVRPYHNWEYPKVLEGNRRNPFREFDV